MDMPILRPAGKRQKPRPKSSYELTATGTGHELLISKGTKVLSTHLVEYGSAPDITTRKPCFHESFSEGHLSRSQCRLDDAEVLPFDLLYNLCEALNQANHKTLNHLALQLGMTQDAFDHVCQLTQNPAKFILVQGVRHLQDLQQLQRIFHNLALFEAISLVESYMDVDTFGTAASTAVSTVTEHGSFAKFETDTNSSTDDESFLEDEHLGEPSGSQNVDSPVIPPTEIFHHNFELGKEYMDEIHHYGDKLFGLPKAGAVVPPDVSKMVAGPGGISSCRLRGNAIDAGSPLDSGIGSSEISPKKVDSFPSSPDIENDCQKTHLNGLTVGSSKVNMQSLEMSLPNQPDRNDSSWKECWWQSSSSSQINGEGRSFSSLPHYSSAASLGSKIGSSEGFLSLSFSGEIQDDCPVVIPQMPQNLVDQEGGIPQKLDHTNPPVGPSTLDKGHDYNVSPLAKYCSSRQSIADSLERPDLLEPDIISHKEQDLQALPHVALAPSTALAGGTSSCLNSTDHSGFLADTGNPLSASATIDGEGSVLYIPDSLIHLRIPPGALSKQVTVHLSVIVDPSKHGCPQSADRPRIIPLVSCEPDGLEFRLPVELVLPHCGIITESNPEFEVYYRHNQNGQVGAWIRDDLASASACLSPWGTRQTCHVMLRHFCDLDIFIKESEHVIGKMLRSFPLVNRVSRPGDDLLLSVWMCDDYKEVYNQIIQEHTSNHAGVLLAGYQSYMLLAANKPVDVKFNCLNEQHTSASSEEMIGYRQLWNGCQGYATFRIKCNGLTDVDGDSLNGTLSVQQEENSERCKFEIQKPVVELLKPKELGDNDHSQHQRRIATQQSYPGWNGQQQLSPLSLTNEELQLFPSHPGEHHLHIHMPSPASSHGFDPPMFPTSPPIFRVSHKLAMELSFCLDASEVLGQDWKMLADNLNYKPHQIEAFGLKEHPTKEVLDAACKSGRLTSIKQLSKIIKDMNRADALKIIQSWEEKQEHIPEESISGLLGICDGRAGRPQRQMSHPVCLEEARTTCSGSSAYSTHCCNGCTDTENSLQKDVPNITSQQPISLPVNLADHAEPPVNAEEYSFEEEHGRSEEKHPCATVAPLEGNGVQNISLPGNDNTREASGEASRPYSMRDTSIGATGNSDGNEDLRELVRPFSLSDLSAAMGAISSQGCQVGESAKHLNQTAPTSDDRSYLLQNLPGNKHQHSETTVMTRGYNMENHEIIKENYCHSSSDTTETSLLLTEYSSQHLARRDTLEQFSQHCIPEESSQTLEKYSCESHVNVADSGRDKFVDISDIPMLPLQSATEETAAAIESVAGITDKHQEGNKMSEPCSGKGLNESVVDDVFSTTGQIDNGGETRFVKVISDKASHCLMDPLHSSTPNKHVGKGDISNLSFDLSSHVKSSLSGLPKSSLLLIDIYEKHQNSDSGFSSPVAFSSKKKAVRRKRQQSCRLAPNFGDTSPPAMDLESSRILSRGLESSNTLLNNGRDVSSGLPVQSSSSSNDSAIAEARGRWKHTTSSEHDDLSRLRFCPTVFKESSKSLGYHGMGGGQRYTTSSEGEDLSRLRSCPIGLKESLKSLGNHVRGGNFHAQTSSSFNDSGIAEGRAGRRHTTSSEEQELSRLRSDPTELKESSKPLGNHGRGGNPTFCAQTSSSSNDSGITEAGGRRRHTTSSEEQELRGLRLSSKPMGNHERGGKPTFHAQTSSSSNDSGIAETANRRRLTTSSEDEVLSRNRICSTVLEESSSLPGHGGEMNRGFHAQTSSSSNDSGIENGNVRRSTASSEEELGAAFDPIRRMASISKSETERREWATQASSSSGGQGKELVS